jgi:RNA polymerase sigma factor (sigma-70 family)
MSARSDDRQEALVEGHGEVRPRASADASSAGADDPQDSRIGPRSPRAGGSLGTAGSPDASAGPACETPADTWSLTGGIARGEREAFSAFYERWFDQALGQALAVTRGDAEEAFDVVQDAMLKIARSMPALPDDAAVSRWLERTVYSAAIDRLRKATRRRRHEWAAAEAKAGAVAPPADEQAQLAEREQAVRERLADLPPLDRAALQSRLEGRTFAEVGARLGLSVHAACARVRRAFSRLRDDPRGLDRT